MALPALSFFFSLNHFASQVSRADSCHAGDGSRFWMGAGPSWVFPPAQVWPSLKLAINTGAATSVAWFAVGSSGRVPKALTPRVTPDIARQCAQTKVLKLEQALELMFVRTCREESEKTRVASNKHRVDVKVERCRCTLPGQKRPTSRTTLSVWRQNK